MNTPLVIPGLEALREEAVARCEEIRALEKLISKAKRISRTDGEMVEELNRTLLGDKITIPSVDELKRQIGIKRRELTVVRRLFNTASLAVQSQQAEEQVLQLVAKRSANG